MAVKKMDLDLLLEYQQQFIEHIEELKLFSSKITKNIGTAGSLLQDDVSKNYIKQISDIADEMKNISIYAEETMKVHKKNTQNEIEQFNNL